MVCHLSLLRDEEPRKFSGVSPLSNGYEKTFRKSLRRKYSLNSLKIGVSCDKSLSEREFRLQENSTMQQASLGPCDHQLRCPSRQSQRPASSPFSGREGREVDHHVLRSPALEVTFSTSSWSLTLGAKRLDRWTDWTGQMMLAAQKNINQKNTFFAQQPPEVLKNGPTFCCNWIS